MPFHASNETQKWTKRGREIKAIIKDTKIGNYHPQDCFSSMEYWARLPDNGHQ